MVDSVKIAVTVFNEESDVKYEQCGFPFLVDQRINETGEPVRFYDWESSTSRLTGAKCRFRAVPVPTLAAQAVAGALGRVGAYEVDVNVPACLIGRNHQLVNGVPRAAEGAFELLKLQAAWRRCTPYGMEQFSFRNVRLKSVTATFLFPVASPDEASEKLLEFRDHAEGVLNYLLPPPHSARKKGSPKCYSVGPAHAFTVYIKERAYKIRAYVKQPYVPDAFATFPNEHVERELVEEAQRTVRIEVEVNESWLAQNELTDPEAWRSNLEAYESIFKLVREVLRLDEGLRVRAPSQDVIAKLTPDNQVVMRAHLAGENVRTHELVLLGARIPDEVILAQTRRFSPFKRDALATASIDYCIPWSIQSSKLSPHLKDWLVYPGMLVPAAHLQAHVFSPASAPPAIEELQQQTADVVAETSRMITQAEQQCAAQPLPCTTEPAGVPGAAVDTDLPEDGEFSSPDAANDDLDWAT